MDIEVNRMSPTAIEILDQLSIVCKRFEVDYYAAPQNQRDLLDSIALHEYQLKKAMVYSTQQIESWRIRHMVNGFGIVALIALYFVIKWAVKNGIKEAYTDITGKTPAKDIQNEKELNEHTDDTKDR